MIGQYLIDFDGMRVVIDGFGKSGFSVSAFA